MKTQNGFATIFILLLMATAVSTAFGGYMYLQTKITIKQNISNVTTSPTLLPSPVSSVTPTKIPLPTKKAISPTPISPAVIFLIKDNTNSPILDNSLALSIKNEDTGKEQKIQNQSSSWSITNLNPGKYKFWISYPTDRYATMEKSCEGCENREDVAVYDSCGYHFTFQTGNHVKISCKLMSSRPLNFPGTSANDSGPGPDTTPPNTNISYPQQNGSITYKIDGKVCAIATQPNDDQGPNGIETEYKFDNGSWSGYASDRAYLCADSLPNGPHTLSYHSKDKSGNVENTKTISFTVNIPGN